MPWFQFLKGAIDIRTPCKRPVAIVCFNSSKVRLICGCTASINWFFIRFNSSKVRLILLFTGRWKENNLVSIPQRCDWYYAIRGTCGRWNLVSIPQRCDWYQNEGVDNHPIPSFNSSKVRLILSLTLSTHSLRSLFQFLKGAIDIKTFGASM